MIENEVTRGKENPKIQGGRVCAQAEGTKERETHR